MITREEMIGMLREHQQLLVRYGHPLIEVIQVENAIAALQAAEPAITVDIRRDPRDGSPSPRILKFADLGDGEHRLFTIPCPPAKAQAQDIHDGITYWQNRALEMWEEMLRDLNDYTADENWREELETIAEILEADGDEWHCAARIRKMLKTSPTKAQVPEGVNVELIAEILSDYASLQRDGVIDSAGRYSPADAMEQADLLLAASPAPGRAQQEEAEQ